MYFFLLIGAIRLFFNVIYAVILEEIVRFKRYFEHSTSKKFVKVQIVRPRPNKKCDCLRMSVVSELKLALLK